MGELDMQESNETRSEDEHRMRERILSLRELPLAQVPELDFSG
jgi:hypothetical protein